MMNYAVRYKKYFEKEEKTMKKSRFILAMLLIFTMAISSVAVFSVYADTENPASDEVKALPSSTTLVGTKHLPPISNQGQIGSCASQSIAYTQMTNAVSRYMHSINPETSWDPSSGNKKYLMSPKFTFDFSGSGTAWVYDILLEHGIATMDKVAFHAQLGNGAYQIFPAAGSKTYWKDTVKWAVDEGQLEEALEIRLQNWVSEEDQIWIKKETFGDSNGDIMLTTSEKGKQLLEKIKLSLLDGNVVVTGGLSGAWQYDKITGNGDIGKIGEECLSWAHSNQTGGHQVSIVGYDDNVECRIGSAVLKGAFLVANSWGTSWANDGYVWLMYDALNSKSEFAAVNAIHPDRYIAMDQFCFSDWKTDIAIGLPDLMVQVEVECVNREGTAVYLTRQPAGTTDTEQYIPKMFYYGKMNRNYHPDYDMPGKSFTFSGQEVTKDSAPETAYFTLSFHNFLATMEEGKNINDYEWGIRVYSVQKEPIVVKSVKLINSNKTVLQEIKLAEGGDKYTAPTNTGSLKYWFDFKTASFDIDAPEGTDVVFTKDTATYSAIGENVSFTLENAKANAKVLVNGTEVTAKDGVYTVKAAETNAIVVTESADVPETTPAVTPDGTTAPETTTPVEDDDNGSTAVIIVVAAVAVVALGVVALVVVKKKKG